MTLNFDNNVEKLQIQVTPEVQVVAHARLAESTAAEQNLSKVVIDTLGYVPTPEEAAQMFAVSSDEVVTVDTSTVPTSHEVSPAPQYESTPDPVANYNNIVDLEQRRAAAQADAAAQNDLSADAQRQMVEAAYRDVA